MNFSMNKKILFVGIGGVAIIAIVIVYFLFFQQKPEKAPQVTEIEKKVPEQIQVEEKPIPTEAVRSTIRWDEVELDKSDPVLRNEARNISSHPQIEDWLNKPNLVRKFVGATDNVVDGLSPRSFLSFLAPRGRFEVYEKYGSSYLDPNCYSRYNKVADVVSSLSTQECLKLYRELKPLIQEAYAQLGYPNKDFNATLQVAVVELLETPIVEGDIMLEQRVVTYKMVDPKLENLSPAQKHLLRMGPKNVRKIQDKLREVARALGISEDKIPKSKVYVPSNKK